MKKIIDWSKYVKDEASKEFVAQKEQAESLTKSSSPDTQLVPIMSKILLNRMVKGLPLVINRPLVYTTEALGGENEDEDDGFYVKKSEKGNAKFETVLRKLPVGTILKFSQFEKALGQFWFKSSEGTEVGIYATEQINLLKSSDIYEEALELLQGDK